MSEALRRARDRFEEILQSTRDTVERARETRARLVRLGISRSRSEEAAEFRRKLVYQLGVRAAPVETSSDRVRLISPGFWANNEAQTHRLVPWLTRELRLLMRLLSPKLNGTERLNDRVTAAVQHLLDLIKRVEFRSPEFRAAVAALVGNARADHFVYEFENFARSPYHLAEYDARVQYPALDAQPVRPSSPVSVSSSSTLSSSLSSLEIRDNISISSSVSIIGEEPRRSSHIDLLDSDSDVELQDVSSPNGQPNDAPASSASVRVNDSLTSHSYSPHTTTASRASSSTFYSIDSSGVSSAARHADADSHGLLHPPHQLPPSASNALTITSTTARTAPSLLEQLSLSPQENRSTRRRPHWHLHLGRTRRDSSLESLSGDESRQSRPRRQHSRSVHLNLRTTRSRSDSSRSRSASRSHRHSERNQTAEASANPPRMNPFLEGESSSLGHTPTERSREHYIHTSHQRSTYWLRSHRSISVSSFDSVDARFDGSSTTRSHSRGHGGSEERNRSRSRARSRSRSPQRGSRLIHLAHRRRHHRAHRISASRRTPSPLPLLHTHTAQNGSRDCSRRQQDHLLHHLPLRRDWFYGRLPRRHGPSAFDLGEDASPPHVSRGPLANTFASGHASAGHHEQRVDSASDARSRSARSRSPPYTRNQHRDRR